MQRTKTPVSDEVQTQIEDLAREQNREPAAVLRDVADGFAVSCRLDRLSDKLGKRALEKGIR
jgi:hypothetical protein